jgi:hypothetical protein
VASQPHAAWPEERGGEERIHCISVCDAILGCREQRVDSPVCSRCAGSHDFGNTDDVSRWVRVASSHPRGRAHTHTRARIHTHTHTHILMSLLNCVVSQVLACDLARHDGVRGAIGAHIYVDS